MGFCRETLAIPYRLKHYGFVHKEPPIGQIRTLDDERTCPCNFPDSIRRVDYVESFGVGEGLFYKPSIGRRELHR